jgi:hypothetical protein
MSRVALITLAAVGLAATVRADEIYRWTDQAGRVHYSNTPVAGGEPTGLSAGEAPGGEEPAGDAGSAGGDGVAGADDADGGAFSTRVSLQRNALERELRDIQERLRDVNRRTSDLAQARRRNFAGRSETSGVGAEAEDLRSDEEIALAAQRDELTRQAAAVQEQVQRLRDEVIARHGTTPSWWVDVR